MTTGQPPAPTDEDDDHRAARMAAETMLAERGEELARVNRALLAETELLRDAVQTAETARLREARARSEANALFRTLDALTLAPDESAVAAALVEETARVLRGAVVFLVVGCAPDRVEILAASRDGLTGLRQTVQPGWLSRERRMADLRHADPPPDLPAAVADHRSLLALPLAGLGGAPLALVATGPEPGQFSAADQRLVGRMVGIAAQRLQVLRETGRTRSLVAVIDGFVGDAADTPVNPVGEAIDAPLHAVNRAIDRMTQVQFLLLEVLSDLLQSPPGLKDAAINRALETLGRFTGSDRAYVFRQHQPGVVCNTHEWCLEGVEPMIDHLQAVPLDGMEDWIETLTSGQPVYVPDVTGLPEGSTGRQLLESQGIRSILMVPMVSGGQLAGFAGYDSVNERRQFLSAELLALRSVANAIDNVLQVRETTGRLAAAHAELRTERDRLQRLASLAQQIEDVTGVGSWEIQIASGTVFRSQVAQTIGGADAIDPADPTAVFGKVDDAARDRFADAFRALCTDGQGYDLELPFRDAEGRPIWVRTTAVAEVQDGHPVRAYGTLKDVTIPREARVEALRLAEIARRTTNLVIVTGRDRRIEWVNPAFERRTGWTMAEVIGLKPGDILQCPETDAAEVARIRAMLDAEQSVRGELMNRDRAGNEYWIDLDIQPLRTAEGDLAAFLAVQTDITEAKRQAAALSDAVKAAEQARATISVAVEALEDAFAYFRPDGTLAIWNTRFRQLFPDLADQVRDGMVFADYIRTVARGGKLRIGSEAPDAFATRVLDAVKAPEVAFEMGLTDGRWLRIVMRRTPDGGRVDTLVDVTDLKAAEARALSERAEAMDASRDGIALTDAKGNFVYMNQAHLAMFGFQNDAEIQGLNWRALYTPAMAEVLEREVMPVVAAQGSWRGEMQGRTRTGDPVEQEVSLTLRPDGGLLCITRDVSERYHAEAERARLAGELEQAQRREMIGQLAAGLAHDFNNLLATISGSASLAAAGLDSGSPAHAHAARILMATEQANGLVRRLLNLGSRKASVQRIDLRDPVREAADLARAGLPRGIVLETDLPDDACPADADPTEIVQIVLNLAINARDAMRQGGGRILVALAAAEPGATEFAVGAMAPDQRCWRIVVADTGPGMTPDVAALVFKPYFSTKGAGGSGLGLASVRSLVASVGGAVRLITEPGEGARFEIFWPLEMRAPDAAPVSGLSRPSQPVLARVQALQGRRILLVDDAEDLLEVLTGFLEAAGALVAATTDPQDALEVLAEDPQSWDLVITDFDMPGLTGADVAHAVKAANPGLPVLLVTALPDWQSRARSADFTGVLGKPVTGRQLVETAARLIAPAEA